MAGSDGRVRRPSEAAGVRKVSPPGNHFAASIAASTLAESRAPANRAVSLPPAETTIAGPSDSPAALPSAVSSLTAWATAGSARQASKRRDVQAQLRREPEQVLRGVDPGVLALRRDREDVMDEPRGTTLGVEAAERHRGRHGLVAEQGEVVELEANLAVRDAGAQLAAQRIGDRRAVRRLVVHPERHRDRRCGVTGRAPVGRGARPWIVDRSLRWAAARGWRRRRRRRWRP